MCIDFLSTNIIIFTFRVYHKCTRHTRSLTYPLLPTTDGKWEWQVWCGCLSNSFEDRLNCFKLWRLSIYPILNFPPLSAAAAAVENSCSTCMHVCDHEMEEGKQLKSFNFDTLWMWKFFDDVREKNKVINKKFFSAAFFHNCKTASCKCSLFEKVCTCAFDNIPLPNFFYFT